MPRRTMATHQLVEKIEVIKQAHPGNLMARHFDAAYFLSLDGQARQSLAKIIASGVENPR